MNNLEDENNIKKIKRENIYAGVLLQSLNSKIEMFDENHNELTIEDIRKRGITYFQVSSGVICRKILFQKTTENVADDLLYYSPKYKIEGYKPKIEVAEDFIVSKPISLKDLLVYFNFKEDLTPSDIKKIYSMFLRKNKEKFYLNNCELFGYKENKLENFIYYENGKKVINHEELKRSFSEQILELIIGYRFFGLSGKEHPIPSEIWELRNIISNRKSPHPVEKEKVLIKTKIHTLF